MANTILKEKGSNIGKSLIENNCKKIVDKIFKDAKKYSSLSYQQVLSDEIAVMDSTAIALCKDNNIPIMVFDIFKKGNISKAVAGEPIGSLIS